jgi:phosphatidylinositol kinase/protein kinase (PI-3  family)
MSIHAIKEKRLEQTGQYSTLLDYFNEQFGPKGKKTRMAAQENFCNSLAAYSLVCYIL